MNNFGFYRFAAVSPKLKVGDVEYNINIIIDTIKQINDSKESNIDVILFPELCITGYSCGDMFYNDDILNDALTGLNIICKNNIYTQTIIVSLPIRFKGNLFNVAAVVHGHKIIGFVPKTYLPVHKEFYEGRQFTSGTLIENNTMFNFNDSIIPFGTDLIFNVDDTLKFGIEMGEDVWTPIPPSSKLCLAGATVIFNPSASNELVGKAAYRQTLIEQQSARCMCTYVYASAGMHESSQDIIYSGHCIIASNGSCVATNINDRFNLETSAIFADVDLQRLVKQRISESSFKQVQAIENKDIRYISDFLYSSKNIENDLKYAYINPMPFVGSTNSMIEVLNIQSTGLIKKLLSTNSESVIIGVSGGLNSILALIVCREAMLRLGRPMTDIVAVTTPGFGTSDRTYLNAVNFIKEIGCTFEDIQIKDISTEMFKAINHDSNKLDVTSENVQAHIHAEVLMNLANQHHGIVICTSDLSEIALGWCKYNADCTNMYSVNCSIPKTLVKYLVTCYAKLINSEEDKLSKILFDICDAPVSPNVPSTNDTDEIKQKIEDILGRYELHDFFLYHFIKYGASLEKLFFLAKHAYNDVDEKVIKKTLKTFITRFTSQQFKRSCIPDGPKVGTISLSPRSDWRMPPDMVVRIPEWLDKED